MPAERGDGWLLVCDIDSWVDVYLVQFKSFVTIALAIGVRPHAAMEATGEWNEEATRRCDRNRGAFWLCGQSAAQLQCRA